MIFNNGVSPQESIKQILKVWKVIPGSWGGVLSDEGFLMNYGDDFTAHHVWSVEECGINVPSLWSLRRNQSCPPCSPLSVAGVTPNHTTSYPRRF